ncbi:MAG: hypothetical protein WBZ05_05025, partial [Desulfobacterales bacterium]
MNKRIYPHTYQDEDDEHRGFFSNFAVSLLCHLVFFVILIFAPGFANDRNPSLSVINVSLVSLPSQNNAPLPSEFKTQTAVEKKDQKTKITTKTTPKIEQKSPESISLK